MEDNQNSAPTPSVVIIDATCTPSSSLTTGLSSVGSAAGLIYGLTMAQNKRWWAILLYMFAGSAIGGGVGYVLKSSKSNN